VNAGRETGPRLQLAFGLAMIVALAVPALAAGWLYPGDPLSIAGPALLAPFTDSTLPLGTDRLGRDVAAELVHSARLSLLVGFGAAALALVAGSLVGTVAGFAGGLVDEALMRIAEAFQTVPGFLLALAFVSAVGPSAATLVTAIALGAWTGPARMVRAEILSLRERDFVAAARACGMHPAEIAFREVLPNALAPVVSLGPVIVAAAILIESSLSFLGLGDANRITWGAMIAEGRAVLRTAPWLSIIPGIAIVATVVGVYLVGDALEDLANPRRADA
jgi:peptide/nickel transport system permease protein